MSIPSYRRPIVETLISRMNEPRQFIQMLVGARQTGKSTAIRQALSSIEIPAHVALASIDFSSRDWLRAQWFQARSLINESNPVAILVVDEIQLVDQWSATVKELWDEDGWNDLDVRVVLSGSSSLLLQKGLKEGLTGRFEVIRSTHWDYKECNEAFGYTLDEFLFFGGYPGSAPLRKNKDRWLEYMNDSIIDPSISRDVISMDEVRKPALMQRLFRLGASYSAQELSYRKIAGQLDDAGNTTTLAHYLSLLDDAALLCGLAKFDPKMLKQKASSPRLMVYDTSLMVAAYGMYRDYLLIDSERKGHLVESAVGAYLLARSKRDHFEVYWWREGSSEVDFVIASGEEIIAIEVKSGRIKSTKGLTAFVNKFPKARTMIVGSAEYPLEAFLHGDIPLFR